jgi:hypothetical protein
MSEWDFDRMRSLMEGVGQKAHAFVEEHEARGRQHADIRHLRAIADSIVRDVKTITDVLRRERRNTSA